MNAPNSASLGAMGSLLRKLDELCIIQDRPLRESIQQLRDGLASICSSLEKLSEVNDLSLTASYWMKDARELSYDTEDFLDQCFFLQGDNSDARVQFMDEISGFQDRVEEVADRYSRYKIEFILSHATNIVAAANPFRIVHRHMDPFVPIGMENLTNVLVEWIKPKDDDKDDNHLKVASILGIQGVGKTTLAQKLWNDESRGMFECRAFVQIAKKPDMRMILISILSQVLFTKTLEAHDVQNLIQDLRRHLQDKRYFIIIDDLWSVSVWDVISCAFPDGNCCSRVLTTTTIEDVALACCSYEPEHVFQMKPLGDDHSKQLFVDRVFGTGNGCPPQFNDVSEELTRKCGGLPLAIVCIASHIASQLETVYQWEQVQNFLCHNVRTNPTSVEILKQAFNLCYNSLPQCLKTCLLYLSVYPENYLILKDDLLKQWMAEGFICTREEENIFEVACSYFNYLVSLGLIQRMDINCNKKGLSYVVHPMLLNFITCKSTEDNFITVIDYSQSTLALSDMIRRLSIHFGSATYASMPETIVLSQVRTLTFMGLLNCMPSLVNFKLVRVIILYLRGDDADKSFSLTGICGLLLLRYLQVKCNVSVELPEQMGCLKQLETLEINSRFTIVPSDIFHLSRLLNVCLGRKTNLALGRDVSVKADYSSLPTPPVFLQRLELLPPICIFSKLPEWIPQLRKLCILEIVVRELWVSDIDIVADLPVLRVLCLYVRRPTTGKIVLRGGAFLALEYFKFICGIILLDFQEKTMPKLRKLKIGFNAHRGMKYDHMLHGIQHLLNLQEVAARIGAATGAEKSDRRAAEFALKNSVRIHQSHQNLKVKRVLRVDEVCCPSVEQNWSHQKESSNREGEILRNKCFMTHKEDLPIEQYGILGEMAAEDTKKKAKIGANACRSSTVVSKTLQIDFFTEYGEAARYQIQEIIGKGSYGIVAVAVDTHTGGRVAIKKLYRVFEHVSDSKRILREIKLLRMLRHPDIVEIKHILLPHSRRNFQDIYIVFELMDTDLYQVIKANDDLTPEHHQFFLYQLLRALKYIHTANVFHRDIKPKNILANANCKLKMCDFGLARVSFNDDSSCAFWTDYVATRWYRAPELCGSFFVKYTPAIDIWSIGCIFAEILSGQPLFPGKNVVHQLELITDLLGTPTSETLSKIRNEKARRYLNSMRKKDAVLLTKKFPNVDPLAIRLLERLLAFDPKDRPTAEEALADPYFRGLAQVEREPSCHPISKLEFEFDTRILRKDDIRELIYREILEYHPQMLEDYLKGTEQISFVYPSGVDNIKRQFAHAEEHYNKGQKGSALQRKHVSLPRERVKVSKDGNTKQRTYGEQRSIDSIARTLVSPTRSQDAGPIHFGQNRARFSNSSSQTYLKSESISASKYLDPSIYHKELRMMKPLRKCKGPSMDPLTRSPCTHAYDSLRDLTLN